jgi:hypothetical protein
MAIQGRDVELLRTVFDYRLISTPQVLSLFEDESRDGIYRRLQKLFHHGYLDRVGSNPNAPLVYSLARRGAEVLQVPVRKNVGDRYVAHQLMIGDVRVALSLAAYAHQFEVDWRAIDPRANVRPDGFFTMYFPKLPEGRNRAHFLVEADRSTMPRERVMAKFVAYRSWSATGRHTETLGIRTFRILAVTRSEERLESLRSAAARTEALEGWHGHIWLTSITRFTASKEGSIVLPIWETPSAKYQTFLP